jgi:AcrR family transcriptional regulator
MGRPPTITRDQLLETARRVFATKGFEAATLADIAGELNVTPAAVLRHCKTKQELFNAAMGRSIEVPDFIRALEATDPKTDPRTVLRNIAEHFVPFIQHTLQENLSLYMHRQARTIVLPFEPSESDSPPRQGLRIVTDYFRRAAAAGVIRTRDPRASALIFMGSLQSYVFLHQILRIAPKPYPLDQFIDALLDLWTRGAIVKGSGGTRARKKTPAESDHPRGRARGGGRGHGRVLRERAASEGAGPVRHAGGAHGQRRVARRRPRPARPHR